MNDHSSCTAGSGPCLKLVLVFALALLLIIPFVFVLTGCGEPAAPSEPSAQTTSERPEETVTPTDAPVQTEEPAPEVTAEPTSTPEPMIYYGERLSEDYVVPKPGEIELHNGVQEVLDDDGYDDYLFSISIGYTPIGSLRRYLYSQSDVTNEFLTEYEQFYAAYVPTEEEQKYLDNYTGYHYIHFIEQKDKICMEKFRNFWKQEHGEIWDEFCEQEERINEIRKNYDLRSEYAAICVDAEYKRLEELGYKAITTEEMPNRFFLLTKEQILNFPYIEDDAYLICFGIQAQPWGPDE